MHALALLFHLAHWLAPAWGCALLLALVLAWRGRARPARMRRFVRDLFWLGLGGSAVLIAGLLLTAADGRMATYALLVLVQGTLAAWRGARA